MALAYGAVGIVLKPDGSEPVGPIKNNAHKPRSRASVRHEERPARSTGPQELGGLALFVRVSRKSATSQERPHRQNQKIADFVSFADTPGRRKSIVAMVEGRECSACMQRTHLPDDESTQHTEQAEGLRDLVRARGDVHRVVGVALVAHRRKTCLDNTSAKRHARGHRWELTVSAF